MYRETTSFKPIIKIFNQSFYFQKFSLECRVSKILPDLLFSWTSLQCLVRYKGR